MLKFRLVTWSEALADHLHGAGKLSGAGWEVVPDLDVDHKGDPVLCDSDNNRLGEFRMDPALGGQVRRRIQEFMAKSGGEGPVVVRGTTGDQDIAKAVPSLIGYGWRLSISYLKGLPGDHVQLIIDRKPIGEVAVEPRATLSTRLGVAIDEHLRMQKPPIIDQLKALQEKQATGQTEQAATPPTGPAHVECAACGQHYAAEWTSGDVPPLLRLCNCGANRFRPWEPDAEPQSIDTVMNPILVAEAMVAADGTEQVIQLPTESIVHGPNVRRTFRNLDDLKASIAAVGIKVPLIVNKTDHGYQLIAGERRLRAAKLISLPTVPCIVRELSEAEAYALMLTENANREPLTAIEWAEGYKRLMELGSTQVQVAERFGLSRQAVGEHLRLLQLPDEGKNAVEDGMAIKAALVFLSRTEGVTETIRNQVSMMFFRDRPSIRDAEAQIDTYLRMCGWIPPKPPVAPSPGPIPTPVTTPTKSATRAASPEPTSDDWASRVRELKRDKAMIEGSIKSGRNHLGQKLTRSELEQARQKVDEIDQELASLTEPGAPAAPKGSDDPRPGTIAQATLLSPEAERAIVLRSIGLQSWKAPNGEPIARKGDQVIFDRECYLPLADVLQHWSDRKAQGGGDSPSRDFGSLRIEIPEQRVWISNGYSSAERPAVKIDGASFTAQSNNGGVSGIYSGNPVYYRSRLAVTASEAQYTDEQLVIQDGGRHVVVTGGYALSLEPKGIKVLESMVAQLPGLPAGVEV